MTGRKSEEHGCDQAILGLSRKCVKTVHFLAAIVGVLGVIIGFAVTYGQFQDQRDQKFLQLNTTVANLAAQGDPKITSSFIHNNLKWMYRENFPMNEIAVTGTVFYMAKFEDADWQGVNMDEAEFACSDQAYDDIGDWEEGGSKIPLCTQLKKVDFTGAFLRKTRFNYADLREVNFTSADLSKAKIQDSVVKDAEFLKGISLRGIQIKNSDFSDARFSPEAKFRCTFGNRECVALHRSDFSSAEMNDVLFRGAEVKDVDFTGAKLKEVRFDCERKRDGKQPCTVLETVCARGADLAGARFQEAEISNVDFTGAALTGSVFKDTTITHSDFTEADLAGARFKDVEFDRVVLDKEQEATARFDGTSLRSLYNARRKKLVSEYPDEIPCDPEWERHITEWMDPIALPK